MIKATRGWIFPFQVFEKLLPESSRSDNLVARKEYQIDDQKSGVPLTLSLEETKAIRNKVICTEEGWGTVQGGCYTGDNGDETKGWEIGSRSEGGAVLEAAASEGVSRRATSAARCSRTSNVLLPEHPLKNHIC